MKEQIAEFLYITDGKMYPYLEKSLEKQNLIFNLTQLQNAARRAKILVLFAPHHNFQDGDYDDWRHMTPTQVSAKASRFSERGSMGAEFYKDLAYKTGDVIVGQHWTASGFANTDLDHQLKRHGIEFVIIVGLEALTCIVRHALGDNYLITDLAALGPDRKAQVVLP